jgi:hypothetical protein
MVEGQIKQELVSYRNKEGLNFSSIKTFDDEGVGVFYKEYILGQRKEKVSQALIIGSLVDDMVLTYRGDMNLFYQHFEDRYVKYDGVKSSAQAFILADTLFDNMMETLNSDGGVTGDFETCFKESFNKIQADGKYKGKTWDKGLEDFEKTARLYFDKRIQSIGKIVVDLKTLSIAENVARVIFTDEFTSATVKGEDKAWLTKVVIEFEFMGVKCKSEVDAIEIDHDKKTVRGVDLKCTYDNEDFPYNYVKNKYYLQQAFYTEAIQSWMKESAELDGYTLVPFKFIVGDTSINNRRPLTYKLSSADMKLGFTGFTLRGTYHKGIHELIQEIKWHIANDIWNCSKEAIENSGVLPLSINYDK